MRLRRERKALSIPPLTLPPRAGHRASPVARGRYNVGVRRPPRVILSLATVLSSLLCVATVVLWVGAQYRRGFAARAIRGGRAWSVEIEHDRLIVMRVTPWPLPDYRTWVTYGAHKPHWPAFLTGRNGSDHSFAGIYIASGVGKLWWEDVPQPSPVSYVRVDVHYLSLATVTALPAGLVVARRRRARRLSSRRARAGLCAACGYDLRATPGRCPECGANSQA
jgi:hypothetical protein